MKRNRKKQDEIWTHLLSGVHRDAAPGWYAEKARRLTEEGGFTWWPKLGGWDGLRLGYLIGGCDSATADALGAWADGDGMIHEDFCTWKSTLEEATALGRSRGE